MARKTSKGNGKQRSMSRVKAASRRGAGSRRPRGNGSGAKRRAKRVDLLLGTIKGAFVLRRCLRQWKLDGPHFLSNEANHFVLDPRDRKTLCSRRDRTSGTTVFRSTNGGRPGPRQSSPRVLGPEGRTVRVKRRSSRAGHLRSRTCGGRVLFRTLFRPRTRRKLELCEGSALRGRAEREGTELPRRDAGRSDHALDPHRPARRAAHLRVALSGGFFETKDGGDAWRPMNEACPWWTSRRSLEFGQVHTAR